MHYPGDPGTDHPPQIVPILTNCMLDGPQTFSIVHPTDPRRSRIDPVGKYLQVFRVLGQKTISFGKRLVGAT